MSMIKLNDIPGVTQEILKKLSEKGFHKMTDFISTKPEVITATSGLPHKKVLAIRRILLSQYSAFPINGKDLFEECLETLSVLPTGCDKLDQILSCGFYSGEVTEVCGVSCSGKSQLCMTWSLNISAELQQNVLYIDSSGSCSPRRLADMLTERINKNQTLSRIKIAKILSVQDLKDLLKDLKLKLQLHEDPFLINLKAIVIDSVTSLLMTSFFTETYMEGNSTVQQIGHMINSLARNYAIAILVVNNMVRSFGDQNDFYKPALGLIWSHVSSVRMELRPEVTSSEVDDEPRIAAVLLRSPRFDPQNRKSFIKIASSGIVDVDL